MANALTIMAGWMNAALDGLEREGLDRAALTQGLRGFEGGEAARDSRVDVGSARRLWRRAGRMKPDPLLGLKVGGALPMQASNVVSVLTAHSASVRQALEMLMRYQTLVSASGRYRAAPEAGGCGWSMNPRPIRWRSRACRSSRCWGRSRPVGRPSPRACGRARWC